MYYVLHHRCSQYLLELITFRLQVSTTVTLVDVASARHLELPSFSVQEHNLATELSQSVALEFGTAYLRHLSLTDNYVELPTVPPTFKDTFVQHSF